MGRFYGRLQSTSSRNPAGSLVRSEKSNVFMLVYKGTMNENYVILSKRQHYIPISHFSLYINSLSFFISLSHPFLYFGLYLTFIWVFLALVSDFPKVLDYFSVFLSHRKKEFTSLQPWGYPWHNYYMRLKSSALI